MGQPNRRRVAVVTDSTAYIPSDLIKSLGITVVPLTLILGDHTWLDGVEIDPPSFYRLLGSSSYFPSTSQPNVETFAQTFRKLAQEYEGIVAILISGKLSGTVESACAAAARTPEISIEVIDSQAAGMMLGLPVIEAARSANRGDDVETVVQNTRHAIENTSVYFVVDTLEYLHRGGRIGGAAKLLGSALNLKPILEIREGSITAATKVRTKRKAVLKLYSLMEENIPPGSKVRFGTMHVNATDEMIAMHAELEQRFNPIELIGSECSPVIGAHVGPGTVAVAFQVE